MPVTLSAQVTYEVQKVVVSGTGAVTVTFNKSIGPERLASETVELSDGDCAPVWAGKAPANAANRWSDLRDQLYLLLQSKGHIPAS